MKGIGDARFKPAANNLTLVRLLLASAVIYSHAFWAVTGSDRDDLQRWLGAPLSSYAVDGFFTVSGLLVYRSLVASGSMPRFALARLTRLLPAMAAMIAVTVIGGAFVTTAGPRDYLLGTDTVRYVIKNLTFVFAHFNLTGLRCGAALCTINGSLWTLPFEVRCYVMLAALGAVGFAGRQAMLRLILPLTAAFAVMWDFPAVSHGFETMLVHGVWFQVDQLDRLWTAFALGILAYELRDRLPLSWPLCAALLAINIIVQLFAPAAGLHMRAVFIAYFVLCLAFATREGMSASWPDYSYGVYIYAFPVMMVLKTVAIWRSPYVLALAIFALTLPFAVASWHLVEKPALDWLRHRQRTAWAVKREFEA